MSFEIIWENEGVKVILTHELTNDFFEVNEQVISDARYKNIKYQIFDFTRVNKFPIESSIIRRIAHSDQKAYQLYPDIKLAIIANQKVMSGLVNMYKTYFELVGDDKTWDTEMFERENDARLWLNA